MGIYISTKCLDSHWMSAATSIIFMATHLESQPQILKIHRGEHNEPGWGLAQQSHPQSCMVSKYAASSPVIPFLIPRVSKGVFHIPSGYLT
jgi:hypothetical protein